MNSPPLPFILPLVAILFVVVWGGGLGASFIFLNKTAIGELGAIIIGLALVLGIPAVASLLTLPRR